MQQFSSRFRRFAATAFTAVLALGAGVANAAPVSYTFNPDGQASGGFTTGPQATNRPRLRIATNIGGTQRTADRFPGINNGSPSNPITTNLTWPVDATLGQASPQTFITGLQFTGGTISLQNGSYSFNYGILLGSLQASTAGVAGTINTPAPPGAVTPGTGAFNFSNHEIVLNQGALSYTGSGLGLGQLGSGSFQLSSSPLNFTGSVAGTVTFAAAGPPNTFNTTINLPNINILENVLSTTTVGVTAVIDVNLQGTLTLTGTYVAPTATLSSGATVNFGNVRAGTTSSSVNMTVGNTGPAGSNLDTVRFPAGSGDFAPGGTLDANNIASGGSTSRGYTYSPAIRGADSLNLQVLTTAQDPNVTLQGTGVGPVFANSYTDASGSHTNTSSGTIDYGTVLGGSPQIISLTLGNITTDGLTNSALTRMTFVNPTIIGPDAGQFTILGVAVGNTIEDGGAPIVATLTWNAPVGPYTLPAGTQLRFRTDENSPLGSFTPGNAEHLYDLAGISTAVPEPSSVALAGLGLAGALGYQWRRRRGKKSS